jgi:hypothetical protein
MSHPTRAGKILGISTFGFHSQNKHKRQRYWNKNAPIVVLNAFCYVHVFRFSFFLSFLCPPTGSRSPSVRGRVSCVRPRSTARCACTASKRARASIRHASSRPGPVQSSPVYQSVSQSVSQGCAGPNPISAQPQTMSAKLFPSHRAFSTTCKRILRVEYPLCFKTNMKTLPRRLIHHAYHCLHLRIVVG